MNPHVQPETGHQVAEDVVVTFTQMFDLSLTKDKMMGMMPGLLLYLARRPEMVDPVLKTMMPMMKAFGLKMNLYIMGKVMGMMMGMTVRHPRIIPGMMAAMPKTMNISPDQKSS